MANRVLGHHRRAWLVVMLGTVWSIAGAQQSMLLADQFIWSGPEGMRVVRITGKFQSAETMIELLRLDSEIGRFVGSQPSDGEKTWRLQDVLVSVDLNANGDVAVWMVAGPRPLISAYVEFLAEGNADGPFFYDFDVTDVAFHFSAD